MGEGSDMAHTISDIHNDWNEADDCFGGNASGSINWDLSLLDYSFEASIDIIVSNAGSSEVNGRYKPASRDDDNIEGSPRWWQDGDENKFEIWYSGGEWRLGKSRQQDYYASC